MLRTVVVTAGRLVGVAIVGRPVARLLDDGSTLEITRVAADGTRNSCSALLAACRREPRPRHIACLATYTLASESGASLRAAGFPPDGAGGGGSWDRASRRREDGARWSGSYGGLASGRAAPGSLIPRASSAMFSAEHQTALG